MEIDRRSLMKGVLASGALLALGTPPWTFAGSLARRPNYCVLLLGGTSADEVFESGARAACASMSNDGLRSVKLKGGLLGRTERVSTLLEQSRGARWIAVMDDASAVIFLELARTASVRLLSMGTHACSRDSSCPLRHSWATTSSDHSAGGLLASQFVQRGGSFSITESFLQDPMEERALTSWSAPGFSSYRSGEADAMHLHCSGLSLSDGCGLIGLTTTDGWITIPQQRGVHDSVRWQSENWVESVGYAVTASALGMGSFTESCSVRAFVHRSRDSERRQPTERFVSFVMDL
ncbi:MAG: hypothetical protein EHM80_03490 [Nitrospiraceae bacterium]|nr:MAG: hypothetical protein EHM80_03490 [Nitrospiraceae bacterium]